MPNLYLLVFCCCILHFCYQWGNKHSIFTLPLMWPHQTANVERCQLLMTRPWKIPIYPLCGSRFLTIDYHCHSPKALSTPTSPPALSCAHSPMSAWQCCSLAPWLAPATEPPLPWLGAEDMMLVESGLHDDLSSFLRQLQDASTRRWRIAPSARRTTTPTRASPCCNALRHFDLAGRDLSLASGRR
jgi:hypothetical protein